MFTSLLATHLAALLGKPSLQPCRPGLILPERIARHIEHDLFELAVEASQFELFSFARWMEQDR